MARSTAKAEALASAELDLLQDLLPALHAGALAVRTRHPALTPDEICRAAARALDEAKRVYEPQDNRLPSTTTIFNRAGGGNDPGNVRWRATLTKLQTVTTACMSRLTMTTAQLAARDAFLGSQPVSARGKGNRASSRGESLDATPASTALARAAALAATRTRP